MSAEKARDPAAPVFRAALYIRLSREDGDGGESLSVANQRALLSAYAASDPSIGESEEYIDDGFSGTDFDRPAFLRMLSDLRAKKRNCVVVKDLSRFGRNYIETGYYIETIFPQLNVRLISINDRFDSSREGDIEGLRLPIKNMINSMYAMDLSKRFCDAYDLHFRIGDYKMREGNYGYVLDKENNTLIIHSETAGIVKLMFRWYQMGYSMSKIAQFLNMAEVDIPSVVKFQLENKKAKSNYGLWTSDKVLRILTLPTYTGDTVLGRKRNRMYNHDYARITKKEEWFVHPNTHPPLVSHRVFDAIEKSRF